jgi:hypothetical protein
MTQVFLVPATENCRPSNSVDAKGVSFKQVKKNENNHLGSSEENEVKGN